MSFEKTNFSYSFTFLGFDTSYEDAEAVVVPVPFDGTTSYKSGTREGPRAIITASRQIEHYDRSLGCEPIEDAVHTLPDLAIDTDSPEKTVNNVQTAIAQIYADNKLPVMLGGEHTITTGAVRAAKQKYGDTLSVLQLDAHSDMRDVYEFSKYNHACVLRRCSEICPITQVGIRSSCKDEIDYFRKTNHFDAIVWAEEATGPDKGWMDRVLNRLTENVYLTIDLDGFDPSIIPAVGTPEPGGLQWYPTLELLMRVIKEKNVIGFDVVELDPIPGSISSDYISAQLVYKLLTQIITKRRKG